MPAATAPGIWGTSGLQPPYLSLGLNLLIWGEPNGCHADMQCSQDPLMMPFEMCLAGISILPGLFGLSTSDFPWTLSTSSNAVGFIAIQKGSEFGLFTMYRKKVGVTQLPFLHSLLKPRTFLHTLLEPRTFLLAGSVKLQPNAELH